MPTITISDATTFMEGALQKLDIPADNARQIAAVVLDSELRGHPDHGLWFFRAVASWFMDGARVGKTNPDPNTRIIKDTPMFTVVDGDKGSGVIGMNWAMDASITKAKNGGMASASITNITNVIALAPFVQHAADEGLIAFACSGFRYPVIPPVGGTSAKFGTNPIAYAAPAGKHPPFLLDFSTAAIAGAKVLEAAKNGDTVEAGMVEYADGSSMTNAADFKLGSSLIFPMAGVKGYGLAMMVDMFANVLGDSDWGHFIWLLDPSQFQPIDKFKDSMDEEINRIKSSETKSDVDEIFYAGERGQRRMAKLRSTGKLPLEPAAWDSIQTVSNNLGITMPTPVAD